MAFISPWGMDMEGQLLRPSLGDPEDSLKGDSQKQEQHTDKITPSTASHAVKARHWNFCRYTSQDIISPMTNLSAKPSQACPP